MLAQNDRPDLQRSGDKAAPERQGEELIGAQTTTAGTPSSRVRGDDLLDDGSLTDHRNRLVKLARCRSEIFES